MPASGNSKLKSSEAAANNSSSKAAGSASKPCDFHYVEVELVGEDDIGVVGIEYLLTLPDGTEVNGWTDSQGKIRVEGIDPGNCQLTFPKLDEEAWENA